MTSRSGRVAMGKRRSERWFAIKYLPILELTPAFSALAIRERHLEVHDFKSHMMSRATSSPAGRIG